MVGREAGQRRLLPRGRLSLEPAPGPVEPDHPRRGLRREAGLLAEPAAQVAVAPAGLGGQRGDVRDAAGGQQETPRLTDLGAHRVAVPAEPRAQHPVDDGEPPGPVRLLPHPLDDLVGERAEHVGPVHVDAGQFAGRHPEQRPRAQRAEPQLDARLAAVVRDQGRRGVQAADQGAVAAGRLPRIDMPGDHERVIQREDHGEVRRGQPAVLRGRHSRLPVPGVPGDERPQRRRGHAPHRLVDRWLRYSL